MQVYRGSIDFVFRSHLNLMPSNTQRFEKNQNRTRLAVKTFDLNLKEKCKSAPQSLISPAYVRSPIQYIIHISASKRIERSSRRNDPGKLRN